MTTQTREALIAVWRGLEQAEITPTINAVIACVRRHRMKFSDVEAKALLRPFAENSPRRRPGAPRSAPKGASETPADTGKESQSPRSASTRPGAASASRAHSKVLHSTNTEFTSEPSVATDVATTCSSVPAQNAAEVEQPALLPDLIAVEASAHEPRRARVRASNTEPDRKRNETWALAEWLYDQAVARGVLDSGRADRADAIRARAVRRDLRAAKDLLESFSLAAIRARAEILIDLRVAGKRRDVPTCRKLLSAWNDVDVVRALEADAAVPPPITMGVTAEELEPYERAARAVAFLHRAPARDPARDRARPPVTPEQRERAREIMRRKAPCVGGPTARNVA